MILSKAQIAVLEKAQATANNVMPRLQYLEALAEQNPMLMERVQELRVKRDYLYNLATNALQLNRQASESDGYIPSWSENERSGFGTR